MSDLKKQRLAESLEILAQLELPRPQLNERTGICLLALCGLDSGKPWAEAQSPLIGIRAMLDFARNKYDKPYAENTRETFRRQTMHQLLEAQIAHYNPDNPARAVNSPNVVYQISPEALDLVQAFGSRSWETKRDEFLVKNKSLVSRYGRAREMAMIPVLFGDAGKMSLSPGAHSELIKAIVEQFAPRFVPGSQLVYAGDTGEKWGYFDKQLLTDTGLSIGSHGKMPDVVLYDGRRNWLILVESVTSHGPVDGKRHSELKKLFGKSKAGLVYVSAFPDRATMKKYLPEIAWETEVWVAEAPSHLIHFNGERFLGPYIEPTG